MEPKRTKGQHELGTLLKNLRDDARMSRRDLAQASGISVGPIKRIETEGHVPKAQTLQSLADGLATYAPDRRDDDLAATYYERLLAAAEFAPASHGQSAADSARDDEAVIRQSLEARYGQDAHFVAAVLAKLEQHDGPERTTILRLLLGGIGDALGLPTVPDFQLARR